jgi:uncharacterized small protein (DUF1192 family)
MTDDVPAADEAESEDELICRYLIAERIDASRPRLSVSEVALLRKASLLMASDATDDAKDLIELLRLAPKVCRAGARPEPRLQDICNPDAPWDLGALSNEMLLDLENAASVACGRGCALRSARMEAAVDLTIHLDGDAPVDVARVRAAVAAVLGDRVSTDVLYPSRVADLQAARGRCAVLEEEVERLKRQLAALPDKVVKLRTAACAAAAVAPPMAPHSHVGDHEGYR